MTDYIYTILPTFQNLGIWGYWAVLFASILEAVPPIGFILPSGIIVGMFGFFAAQGYYDIKDLVWIAGLGAVIGDAIGYYLGTKGTRFFRNENKILRLSHPHSRKGRALFFNAIDRLQERGMNLTATYPVHDPVRLPEVVQEAIQRGGKLIIVGGGDGTVSSIVDQFAYKDIVLGLLPLGTGNNFVTRTMKIPKSFLHNKKES